ncbi:GNAT family N-acetyltransferase [Actinoplanes aureus]|jgi:RimJ/RimL family protein N-acetyltransferase|uniref:GNAT family N-acetyltransferase n=1 Tax=Actinoplanes aureus TaxID=2792083 RepID=A0A931G181_9ACTN|nr:GNAT family N-acetyltransferase [Actinoplanes aureus]MBG0567598.1 GNAT family N-acetyltransferase [Actinoplanes aureus]
MRSLISPRLLLREWEEKDADFILDMYSRQEVFRFLGSNPQAVRDHDGALAKLARWRDRQDERHAVWAIQDRRSGRLLGTALLVRLMASGDPMEPADETEIGWHLHPDAWGNGYATEAANAVLAYAARMGLPTVLAVSYPENTASQAVCRRLGMRHLGQTDRYYNLTCELFTT